MSEKQDRDGSFSPNHYAVRPQRTGSFFLWLLSILVLNNSTQKWMPRVSDGHRTDLHSDVKLKACIAKAPEVCLPIREASVARSGVPWRRTGVHIPHGNSKATVGVIYAPILYGRGPQRKERNCNTPWRYQAYVSLPLSVPPKRTLPGAPHWKETGAQRPPP